MFAASGALVGHLRQYRIYVRWKARRLFAQIRNKSDATYAWDESKPYWNDVNGQAATSWDTFIKAREDELVMILYFNDVLYQIVPKRWFDRAGDLARFRTHLRFIY